MPPPALPTGMAGTGGLQMTGTCAVQSQYTYAVLPVSGQQNVSCSWNRNRQAMNSYGVNLSTPVLCCFRQLSVSSTSAWGWNRNRQAMNSCGVISQYTCAMLHVSGSGVCPPAFPVRTAVVLYLSTPVPLCFQQSLQLKQEHPGCKQR